MGALISAKDATRSATSITGGSWTATLPLTNILTALLSQKARSTNALAASTLFNIDMGAAVAVQTLCLASHNISASGTIRVRAYSDSGYTTLVWDSTTITAWPAGFTSTDVMANPNHWTYFISTAKTARYWKVEIVDTTNSSGYIELGRMWIGAADFMPARSILAGFQLGWELLDVSEDSLGGVTWTEARTPRRLEVVTFPDLTAAEIRAGLLMIKNLTTAGEILFITESSHAAADMLLHAFPAKIKTASPLSYPYFNRADMPLVVIEIV